MLTWPKDRIAIIAVGKNNRILLKELVYADEVMLRLTNPKIERILLWGYLDQLETFKNQGPDYGFFWGRLSDEKVMTPLSQKEHPTLQLKCSTP